MLKTLGSGNGKKICILFQENGLGDAICFLPALWQKISEGYEITLYARKRSFYEKLNLTFIDREIKGQIGTIEILQKEFSIIYSIDQLCLEHEQETNGLILKTRFEQHADAIETSVPKEFDFLQFFDLEKREKRQIIISLYSASRSRRYVEEIEVHNEFFGAYNEHVIDYEPKLIGLFMQEPEKDLVNLIYNAKVVVSIDNGVLHLAMALGTPAIALMGGSDEWSIVHQYRRFGRMQYKVLRSDFRDNECKRPCSFQQERGYNVNGKCSAVSDCLHEIEPERILDEVRNLLKEI